MTKFKSLFVLCLLFLGLTWQDCLACTTFQIVRDGQVFVGKSYDFLLGDGLFVVNKRGVLKTAMPSIRDDAGVGQPAGWTSKYGSITINQYGRELPIGGMNEVGLVVETMGLFEKSKYPEPDSRPSIFMQQWTQYQLDNFASVKEVLESDFRLRIRPKAGVHIHFLVSDRNGNCAAIEFIDGKMAAHVNEHLPYTVLTNSTYDDSLEFLAQDKIPDPDRFKSIERFIRVAKMLDQYKQSAPKPLLDYSFDILKSVVWSVKRENWSSHTQWSIVYDASHLRIYFKTLGNQKIREINLKSFDFSCRTPVEVLDINTDLSGDITDKFIDYSRQINRNLVETSFNKTIYLPKFPKNVFDNIANYPDTTACSE